MFGFLARRTALDYLCVIVERLLPIRAFLLCVESLHMRLEEVVERLHIVLYAKTLTLFSSSARHAFGGVYSRLSCSGAA